jgi:chromosome segregation ATPase
LDPEDQAKLMGAFGEIIAKENAVLSVEDRTESMKKEITELTTRLATVTQAITKADRKVQDALQEKAKAEELRWQIEGDLDSAKRKKGSKRNARPNNSDAEYDRVTIERDQALAGLFAFLRELHHRKA